MPKYDFICPEGHTKEVTCKVSEYDSEQDCTEIVYCTDETADYCDKPMDRVYTTFGVVIR